MAGAIKKKKDHVVGWEPRIKGGARNINHFEKLQVKRRRVWLGEGIESGVKGNSTLGEPNQLSREFTSKSYKQLDEAYDKGHSIPEKLMKLAQKDG